MEPAREMVNHMALQRLHDRWRRDNEIIVRRQYPRLAKVVEAPRPHATLRIYRKVMMEPCVDPLDLAFG